MTPRDFDLMARAGTIDEVKSTLSSWDSCMAKSYCKWPVIVVIIVGSLILLAVAWCIIGCLCCGYTCCKGCCSCCSCCCPSGRKPKRSKYADDPAAFHNPDYGYQPNPPPPVYEPQNKFATFDATSRPAQPVNEDALPAMPSWSDARTRHVEDHSHDMEMNRLDPSTGQTIGAVGRPGRGGYYEVPNTPGGEGYRGTETTTVPYRHPSPAIVRQPSIGIARQPSPAIGVAQTLDYPGNDGMHSPYMDSSPVVAGGMYPDRMYTRSPLHTPQPPIQRTYSPYQPNAAYAPYSPSIPSSPPPPFTSVAGDNEQSARPPTMLMPGRKPAQGSWRDV